MRVLINGVLYDTTKAKVVAQGFWRTLYRTPKGRFFLHERENMEERIRPLTEEEALGVLRELELVVDPEELGLPYEEA